ncbi:4-hydroxythreonine-4-phosphate dehydrogenase PdxA [Pseudofulvimonas gallinarii]|uniref:4-hydroxythreonine-4-phosphate dehydrogenase n=1 Tax=Pseudofulvimonas gallinarii TaxID=634155 RepID=A0A4S3KZF1_9GAMM|nr:4-hydroxythreonine-4-phosphate dehydrogenase PdxA [Pseudofulvimonas gallinarii]TCS99627.1 4-hydroxythreonine-4-phosphate dehydrogenase [Pseudofulvimonas gallinarii]THD14805.1 4-hydroxythreonine-4-phosphate dehydrogenase PdxA [Pseudofulvimonas gallinarii]
MAKLPRLAVTLGEPAGIGPELAVRLAHSDIAADLVLIGDADLLAATATHLGEPIDLTAYDPGTTLSARGRGAARLLDQRLAAPATPGRVDAGNGRAVLATLARAADGCLSGEFDAVMTLPVHKGVINDAGIAFSGHTEFFADRSGSAVLMLLVAGDLRVALATTHLPLRSVPDAISPPRLAARLRLLHAGLRRDFGIAAPRIAVLGLNPHAGEGGHLGREELEIIAPTLARLREEGLDLDGPLSADTAFVPERRARYDAYFAMYHDQGLPVLKALGFGGGVNVSLGLPFVRTSVDHGVALDIAGTGRAEAGSTLAAAQLALAIAARRQP